MELQNLDPAQKKGLTERTTHIEKTSSQAQNTEEQLKI